MDTIEKMYMWSRLSIPLFGHAKKEEDIERAVKEAFDGRNVILRHVDPVDPVHGRNGWLFFNHEPLREEERIEITERFEKTFPPDALRGSPTLRWEGWVVETRAVFALGPYIQ